MNYIEDIKRKYAISEQDSQDISQLIIQAYAYGIKSVDDPCAIYIGGQPGSGKSCLQINALDNLSNNSVICDIDNFRDFHPHAADIKKNHELMLGEITNDNVRKWCDDLRKYCQQNKLNYIQEISLRDGHLINNMLKDVKDCGYRGEVQLLAVDPKLSILGIYQRFEESKQKLGTGRMVPIEFHDYCCQCIPHAIQRIQHEKIYDDVKVFARTEVLQPEINTGATLMAHNPKNLYSAYQNEINRPWPKQLQECYVKRRGNVIDMMETRGAPRKEIDQCKRQLELPDERSRSFKQSLYY